MYKLLVVLLLTGCVSDPFADDQQGGRNDAEKIYNAESSCMKSGDYKEASEYNACVDKALGNNETAKLLVAERAERAIKGPSTNGLSDADRLCERYGHIIGTEDYRVCIEYANENPANRGISAQK